MAMLALPGALITSCSKENPTENVVPKGDKLTISVLGINDGNNSDKSGKRASNTRASFAGSDVSAPKLYEFSDVDMAVSIDNALPVRNSKQNISARFPNGLASSGLRAAEQMESGIKYVIYIYDGEEFVTSAELEAGTQGTIEDLDPTGSYNWVALSYHNEDSAPDLAPTSSGSIDNLPANTDVLYAVGTVDLAEDPTIGITFDHAFARVGVELNTIGLFGEFSESTPTISITGASVATGSIDLLSGDVTPGEPLELSLAWEDFVQVNEEYDDSRVAYFYTAASGEQGLTISLQGLSVDHVDQVGGVVTRDYFAAQAAEFNTAVTPELGNSKRILVNLVESPLVTNYNGNTVRWARSNLYYRGDNGGQHDYAFYANNEQTARADGYFPFGGVFPGAYASSSNQGDPCALVYPLGTWKTPSFSDFNQLVTGNTELGALEPIIGASGVVSGIINLILTTLGIAAEAPNSSSGGNYAQYDASGGGSSAFDDGTNNLRFYYNGQITDIAALSAINDGGGLVSIGASDLSSDNQGFLDVGVPLIPSYGNLVGLWTDEVPVDLGLASLGTWSYFGLSQDPAFGSERVVARRTSEIVNRIGALGIDVLSTSLKNVRCVRN